MRSLNAVSLQRDYICPYIIRYGACGVKTEVQLDLSGFKDPRGPVVPAQLSINHFSLLEHNLSLQIVATPSSITPNLGIHKIKWQPLFTETC